MPVIFIGGESGVGERGPVTVEKVVVERSGEVGNVDVDGGRSVRGGRRV